MHVARGYISHPREVLKPLSTPKGDRTLGMSAQDHISILDSHLFNSALTDV